VRAIVWAEAIPDRLVVSRSTKENRRNVRMGEEG